MRYSSRRSLAWCVTWPAVIHASALTENGFPLATPRLSHASTGRLCQKASVAAQDRLEFRDVTLPRPLVRSRPGDRDILIEPRQFATETARKPECPKTEHALGVVDVARDLANRPLVAAA